MTEDNYSNEELEEIENNEYKVTFLNVFLCYFKNLFAENKDAHMFTGIDYNKNESTTRCLEFIYNELYKYQEVENQDPTRTKLLPISKVDLDKFEELYILLINGEQKYMCEFLVPIIEYVATLDWTNIKWSIMPLKTEY